MSRFQRRFVKIRILWKWKSPTKTLIKPFSSTVKSTFQLIIYRYLNLTFFIFFYFSLEGSKWIVSACLLKSLGYIKKNVGKNVQYLMMKNFLRQEVKRNSRKLVLVAIVQFLSSYKSFEVSEPQIKLPKDSLQILSTPQAHVSLHYVRDFQEKCLTKYFRRENKWIYIGGNIGSLGNLMPKLGNKFHPRLVTRTFFLGRLLNGST